ncbi:MAG: hypothetical protein AVDCRST_MAG27-2843, partial [uncultured Craurococcus sp.]
MGVTRRNEAPRRALILRSGLARDRAQTWSRTQPTGRPHPDRLAAGDPMEQHNFSAEAGEAIRAAALALGL